MRKLSFTDRSTVRHGVEERTHLERRASQLPALVRRRGPPYRVDSDPSAAGLLGALPIPAPAAVRRSPGAPVSRSAPARARFAQSHRSDLNRRPLDYESRALPLSYGGAATPTSAI